MILTFITLFCTLFIVITSLSKISVWEFISFSYIIFSSVIIVSFVTFSVAFLLMGRLLVMVIFALFLEFCCPHYRLVGNHLLMKDLISLTSLMVFSFSPWLLIDGNIHHMDAQILFDLFSHLYKQSLLTMSQLLTNLQAIMFVILP